MAREYHIAAVDDESEVSPLTSLTFQTRSAPKTGICKAAMPLKDSDTLLLILSRETASTAINRGVQ